MSPELWKIVKLNFDKAFEMSPSDRARFLETIEDTTRVEVLKMLAAIESDDQLLNQPIVEFRDFAEQELPERIGDYRIVREIGEGGMGTVYEAVQQNGRFYSAGRFEGDPARDEQRGHPQTFSFRTTDTIHA